MLLLEPAAVAAVVVAIQTLSRPLAGTDYLSVFPISEVIKTLAPLIGSSHACNALRSQSNRFRSKTILRCKKRIAVSLFGVKEYISKLVDPSQGYLNPGSISEFTKAKTGRHVEQTSQDVKFCSNIAYCSLLLLS